MNSLFQVNYFNGELFLTEVQILQLFPGKYLGQCLNKNLKKNNNHVSIESIFLSKYDMMHKNYQRAPKLTDTYYLLPTIPNAAFLSHKTMINKKQYAGEWTFPPTGQFPPDNSPPEQFPIPTKTIPPPVPLKTQLENYIHTYMYAHMHTYIHCIVLYFRFIGRKHCCQNATNGTSYSN